MNRPHSGLKNDDLILVQADLMQLYNILQKESHLFKDATPIYRASEKCRSESNAREWVAKLDGLVLTIPEESLIKTQNTIPRKVSDVEVELNCIIHGKYFSDLDRV